MLPIQLPDKPVTSEIANGSHSLNWATHQTIGTHFVKTHFYHTHLTLKREFISRMYVAQEP